MLGGAVNSHAFCGWPQSEQSLDLNRAKALWAALTMTPLSVSKACSQDSGWDNCSHSMEQFPLFKYHYGQQYSLNKIIL